MTLEEVQSSVCECGHERESHNRTVVIEDKEYQTACDFCTTCNKYLLKSMMEALREYRHEGRNGKTRREEILTRAERNLPPSEGNSKKKKPQAKIYEIKKLDISQEDWQAQLLDKYNTVKEKADAISPHIWPALDFALSVKTILNIKDCTLPFMGIILGKPSSSKTLVIELFRDTYRTFYSDSFSPRSFVSHNSGLTEDQLKDIDLLPRIKDNLFLTPELAPVFSARDEDLTNMFGIITRILDGNGYESDTGAQGHRGYTGEYMFTWLGAAVEIPRKVHRLLSTLGPKLYFFRLRADEKKDIDYVNQIMSNDFHIKRKELINVLREYLVFFERGPEMQVISGLPKMEAQNADTDILLIIVKLAKLLGHLRGTVPTWESRDTEGADYAYSLATIEEPSRAMTQLYNLAKGHALSQGRTKVEKRDLKTLVQTVLSTAPSERVAVFDLLLAYDGTLTTSNITEGLNTTSPTARRTMVELKALGLVMMEQEGSSHSWQITLKDDFSWFKTDEFKELREESLPLGGGRISFSDNKDMAERKTPPTQTTNMVKCPYCQARYSNRDLVIKHSLHSHQGKPVTDDLDKQEGSQ